MFRYGCKYSLEEILFIRSTFDDIDEQELSELTGRSIGGLNSKFPKKAFDIEDGRTSCRGVKQYKNISELYAAFGEIFPEGEKGIKDIQSRVERYRDWLIKRR